LNAPHPQIRKSEESKAAAQASSSTMPRGDEEQQQLDKVGEEEETEDVPAGDQAKLAAALHGIKEGKEAAG
jgi:hypothetical protein